MSGDRKISLEPGDKVTVYLIAHEGRTVNDGNTVLNAEYIRSGTAVAVFQDAAGDLITIPWGRIDSIVYTQDNA